MPLADIGSFGVARLQENHGDNGNDDDCHCGDNADYERSTALLALVARLCLWHLRRLLHC